MKYRRKYQNVDVTNDLTEMGLALFMIAIFSYMVYLYNPIYFIIYLAVLLIVLTS